MENKVSIQTIVANAKKTCGRDGYPQIIFIDKYGDYTFTRLYTKLNLWDAEEVVGIVEGRWQNGIYTITYYSNKKKNDKDVIKQYIASYQIRF